MADSREDRYIATISDLIHLRSQAVIETLRRIEAEVEMLPRNEFGDAHYLAVEAAYRRVIDILRAVIDILRANRPEETP